MLKLIKYSYKDFVLDSLHRLAQVPMFLKL